MSDPRWPYSGHRHLEAVKGSAALDVRQLVVGYPGEDRRILNGIDWTVRPGERWALVGPNGSGKSTLIKACVGLLPVVSGTIRIFGNFPGACHHRVAYLAQRSDIDWRFPTTVEQFVAGGRYVHRGWLSHGHEEDRRITQVAIDQMDIGPIKHRQIGKLSGGQQQRTLLARALAQEADLLLLDEPLNAVDAETREAVATFLGDLRRTGKTAIVATHHYEPGSGNFDAAFDIRSGKELGR